MPPLPRLWPAKYTDERRVSGGVAPANRNRAGGGCLPYCSAIASAAACKTESPLVEKPSSEMWLGNCHWQPEAEYADTLNEVLALLSRPALGYRP